MNTIEEIDSSVGEILSALRKQKLHKRTIVVFTSDNGPWALFKDHGGSAGLLYGAEDTSYEGGQRVPGIFLGPENVSPGNILMSSRRSRLWWTVIVRQSTP